jgi:hypothetical protein
MQMTKPLEKGGFVVHGAHPEHGLGRVLSIGAFATRVLFTHGGVRVFRVDAPSDLTSASHPAAEDIALLEQKEAAIAHGPTVVMKVPSAAKPRKPRARTAAKVEST